MSAPAHACGGGRERAEAAVRTRGGRAFCQRGAVKNCSSRTPENPSNIYICVNGSCHLGSVVQFKPRPRRREPPPATAATRPNKPAFRPAHYSVAYHAIEGYPLHWRDNFGMVHA